MFGHFITHPPEWRNVVLFFTRPKTLGVVLFILLILVNVVYFLVDNTIPTLIIADAEFAVASIVLVGVVQKNSYR